MHNISDPYDVIVVGGGLNGLAACVALAGDKVRIPLRVCLIDAADPARFAEPSFDGRASAVTESSRRMLEALGVWPQIMDRAEAMREIVVTDSHTGAAARPALLQFGEAHAPGVPSAHMVENHVLYGALHGKAVASQYVEIRTGSNVAHYRFERSRAGVELADGTVLGGHLVVAADGRRSGARAAAGIDTLGWSYPQSGLTFTVEHERDHEGRAEEHFLPAGPFAILPLTGRRSSIVWTEDTTFADELMAMDDDQFFAEFAKRFGDRLGRARIVSRRFCYPLSLQIARQFCAPRLVLIGDAAHVVHPIAGLGFNLGLRDIAALAEVLGEAVKLGLDIGGDDIGGRYQAWRRLDTVMVAAVTDGINRLFSNDAPGLRALRDAGLNLVNQAGPLKSLFMREAAGLSGSLPRLLQGELV